ncbi:MAG: 3',5'-cyclic-AMP phosphodiesterase [Halieaceae bacterium]|nr:3',5'-cyclic-AMP phosphodiesterase [Halieaceae bacterium]
MSAHVRELELNTDPLRVVQITDTHLSHREGGSLLGLDTDFSLQQVIKLALAEPRPAGLVLATGDIADNGDADAYRRARRYLRGLAEDTFWLVGNHDCMENMQGELGNRGQLVRVINTGHWQIVLLDSHIPGETGGELGEEELAWLEQCLGESAARGLHSLVCLHHQPIPVGSAWIDQQMVRDREQFFAVIDRYPQVRGVLWGHVHQDLERSRGGVRLLSTPSTCVQFAPDCDVFKVDDASPGYRWLDLYSDGRIETGVRRVQGVEFAVDLESRGYQ